MNNDEIIAQLRALLPEGAPVQLPPPVIETLGLRFCAYVPGTSISVTCPAAQALTGPMGVIQGGVLGVALDAAYGALAYLEMKQPCVSVTMDLRFVRPLPGDGQEFQVQVSVLDHTRNFIFMHGRVINAAGKTVARSSSTMQRMA